MRTRTSVRMPSFFGPFALAAGLLTVCCFSEPFWQNFYVIEAKSLNTTMKAGAWGVCTRLRNTTGVQGPTTWCTSKTSGYVLNFVTNSTGGINQFPTVNDDATLFGTNGDAANTVAIFKSGSTGVFWLHVVSAVLTILTLASLASPPSYFGPDTNMLHQFQKSGMLTIVLAVVSAILTFVTFCVDLATIVPATHRLAAVDGIDASLGNIQWFALPSAIVMVVAIVSVTMAATPNSYSDL